MSCCNLDSFFQLVMQACLTLQASVFARHRARRDTAAACRVDVSVLASILVRPLTPPEMLASWLAQLMSCSVPYTCVQQLS